ncbi:hypothetical protein [uncultured Novosphingobium sp.]|uniref:hypothetical protein n=1 Tax=uncultured Novosphingobium sp. TaxID=292277 RepID=UPI0025836E86|nr:hypothetical protein [uncultured Novosphingobium sp.]
MIETSPNHSIGDEIPYRRSTMDRRTGSLVFDKRLDEKLAEGSPQSTATSPAKHTGR